MHKFHDNNARGYINEIFPHAECNGIPTLCSYQKLKLPHCKTNQGLRTLLYNSPSLWNNLDKSLKTTVSLNAFKHNLKDYYFRKGNKKEFKSDTYNKIIMSVHSNWIIIFILFIYIHIYLF